MIHGIEELVLVYEATKHKVYQTEEENEPRRWKCAVHDADDEDQQCLRKVEAIAENGWLNQLCIIWSPCQNVAFVIVRKISTYL